MAEAYVAGGPAQGNPMMAGFGTSAEELDGSIEAILAAIEEVNLKVHENVLEGTETVIGSQRFQTLVTLGGQIVLLAALVLMLLFFTDKFRKLQRTAEIAKQIADGNLEAPRPETSRWEELAAMESAIEVFRTNGEKLRSYQAEIDHKMVVAADHLGQIAAISKSQAVVVFDLEGHVLDANDNFLGTMGYSLGEIKGRQHATFVEPAYAASPEYKALWDKLRRGEFDAGEYKRIARGGREVWLQAAYNPILDLSGKPVKVIKYATDVTQRKTVIDAVQKNLNFLAEGDLGARIGAEIGGDYVALRDAFNDTMDRLQKMVLDIQGLSNSMATESDTIATSAVELSKRTDSQAAAVQETSAAMEEIASTIRQNAENAGNAEKVAGEAALRAGAGGGVVTQAISAMERIETSSSKISDIISVIDSIAFQTNLLALNAAVEAARAGDAGKGFAVVASEVRNLAQRSSNAAKDISDLISSSSRHISDGAQLVRQSGEAFQEINRKIDAVVRSVSEISVASREQAAGVTDISTAISQIDGTTQDNARLSEQSSENARTLVEKTNGLRQLVSFFRAGAPEKSLDADWARTEHRTRTKVAVGGRARPTAVAQDNWQDF